MTVITIVDEPTDVESEDDMDISTSFFQSSDDDDSVHHSNLLYKGAPPDLTEYITNLLLFQYSVRHSLTSKALKDLLCLVAVLLPKDAKIPKSVNQLKKYFTDLYSEQQPNLQAYCPCCHKLLSKSEACSCPSKSEQFISIPIGPQVKARLESKVATQMSV